MKRKEYQMTSQHNELGRKHHRRKSLPPKKDGFSATTGYSVGLERAHNPKVAGSNPAPARFRFLRQIRYNTAGVDSETQEPDLHRQDLKLSMVPRP